MLNNPTTQKTGSSITECIRCGTCCEKGGPGFHQADRMLIEKGVIPSRYLYTIREGELARDNVKGCLKPVESDIIKINGKEDTWTCIFFDEVNKGCTIYDDRPLECRALKCWDTRELEQIYATARLTRKDLVSGIKGLWDLIEDHQTRCDYKKIQKLIKELSGVKPTRARQKLLEIIRYDGEIRNLVISRGGLDADMLDFLFGRPLTQTLGNYGVKIHQKGEKIVRLGGE
ncbi:MAG: YkgJ family cysteine cluster protein [Desulfobacterales bacterium]